VQKLVGIGGAFLGKEVFLNDFQTLGRGTSATIVVDDPAVSRDQCRITRNNGICQVFAADLAAPMLVNGHQTQGAVLRHLDTITIGRTTLQFVDLTVAAPSIVPSAVSADMTQQLQPGYIQPYPVQGNQRLADISQSPVPQAQQGPWGPIPPGTNVNSVNVQVKSDNTALWVLLAVIFACPLMMVGLMAIALLPYTMIFVGAVIGAWGLYDHLKYRNVGWPTPNIVLVRMWGGAITAFLGLVLLIALNMASIAPTNRQEPTASKVSALNRGMTTEQVKAALGEPDRENTRRFSPGSTIIVYDRLLGVGDTTWIYSITSLKSAELLFDRGLLSGAAIIDFDSPGNATNVDIVL
jgi:hypothetical protein